MAIVKLPAYEIVDLPLIFLQKLPSRSLLKVFHNRSFLSGSLIVDGGTFAADPWEAAMKWREHMEARGWELSIVESRFLDRPRVVVAVLMEKL